MKAKVKSRKVSKGKGKSVKSAEASAIKKKSKTIAKGKLLLGRISEA